jgi:hypothetical protein
MEAEMRVIVATFSGRQVPMFLTEIPEAEIRGAA